MKQFLKPSTITLNSIGKVASDLWCPQIDVDLFAESDPKQYNPYQNWPSTIGHLLVTLPRKSKESELTGAGLPKDRKDTLNTSSSDSSEHQFEYTREHLLGAVEKVRSGYLLNRASPYRHSTGILGLLVVCNDVNASFFTQVPTHPPTERQS